MKNLLKFSLVLLLITSVSTFFLSCDDIALSDLDATVSQDKTIVRVNDTLKITINATTSTDEVASVTISKGGNPLLIPAISDNEDYNETLNYVVTDGDGEIEFTITVTGINYVGSIVKTIKANVVSDNDITLGAKTSPLPSFINGTTLKTYNSADAALNQELVDIVYTYSATDGAIIGAPSDPAFTLASWTTKNATKIAKINEQSLSAVDGISGTSVKGLVTGDLIGYLTVGGTKGIIVVKNVVVGDDGNTTMTFSVIK
ncbi:MAG: hypothetical protein HOD63_03845 [Bacteroidetes bacterium]|jgi:hypothetical protein|nr:hypothetical protein [Bacteroidota bacterium]MBT7825297.1 hypothetical protein [Bacteroidota bacterium]